MTVRLVAFDLDGTLVDSQQAIVGCFQHALGLHGLRGVPDHAIAANIGLPLGKMLDGLADPELIPGVLSAYSLHFPEWDRRHTRPFDGVIDALRALRSTGVRMVVASSKSHRGVVRVVKEQGMDGLFDALWGGDRVTEGKPRPEMLERVMAEAERGADETLMVGDTTWDIRMAVAAGVPAVGVSWGLHPSERLLSAGAARVLSSTEELGALVPSCAAG